MSNLEGPVHCSSSSPFSPSDVSSYIIYAGRYQLNGQNLHESSHRVRQVVIPSGYNEPHNGKDVALVQLSSPVTWSDYIGPVCLPASSTLFPSGMMCSVTGWGNTRDDGRTYWILYIILSSSSTFQRFTNSCFVYLENWCQGRELNLNIHYSFPNILFII